MKDDDKGEKKGFFTLFKKIKKQPEQTESDRFQPKRSEEEAPGNKNTEELPGHMQENRFPEKREGDDLPDTQSRKDDAFERERDDKSLLAAQDVQTDAFRPIGMHDGEAEKTEQEIETRVPLVPRDRDGIRAVTDEDEIADEVESLRYHPLVPQESMIKVIDDEDSGIRITAVDDESDPRVEADPDEDSGRSRYEFGGRSEERIAEIQTEPLAEEKTVQVEYVFGKGTETTQNRDFKKEIDSAGDGRNETDLMASVERDSEKDAPCERAESNSERGASSVNETDAEESLPNEGAQNNEALSQKLTRREMKERLKEQKKKVKIGFLRKGEQSSVTYQEDGEKEGSNTVPIGERDQTLDGVSKQSEEDGARVVQAEDFSQGSQSLHNLENSTAHKTAEEKDGALYAMHKIDTEQERGSDCEIKSAADDGSGKSGFAASGGSDGFEDDGKPQSNADEKEKRVCIYCGTQAEDDEAEFCSSCGKSLSNTQFCYGCGATIKAGAQFCSRCGNNLEKQKGKKFKRKMGAAIKGAGKKIAGAASLAKAGMANDESGNKYILRSFLPALAILTAFFVLLTTGLDFVALRVEYTPSGFAPSATSGFAAIGTLFTGITMLDESFESLIPIRVAGALYLILLIVLLAYIIYAFKDAGKYTKRTVSLNVLFIFLIALLQLAVIVVYAVISSRYTQFVASKVGISAIRLSTSSIWAFVFSMILLLVALHMSAKFKAENTVSKTFINWKKAARPVIAISMSVVAVVVATSVLSVTVKPPAEKVWINYVNAINAGDLERGLKTVYREGSADYNEVLKSTALQQQMGFYDGAKVISYYYREEKKTDSYVQATVSVVYRREDRTVKYKYGLHFAKSSADDRWYFMSLPNIASGNIYNENFNL